MAEQKLWVSSKLGTCQVNVRDGLITWTAPLWEKFIGQPFMNLQRWLCVWRSVQVYDLAEWQDVRNLLEN